jgi:glycosyltransferase involved in cell wall biosynthesis
VRIAYIASGAAGMLCGTCMHDNTLGAALLRLGHEVAVIPTYTPMRVDEPSVSRQEVFYGALNVYLEQSSALFRHVPRRLRDWLDRPGLLSWVSRWAGSTNASQLGALTYSVLRGEEGNQRAELERLASWLASDYRPQVIHLSNSLFLGLARQLRAATGAPVVVSLQGEDLFVEGLEEPWRARVIGELRARAEDAAMFTVPTRDYAVRMAKLLAVDPARMRVARLAVSDDTLAPAVMPSSPSAAAGDASAASGGAGSPEAALAASPPIVAGRRPLVIGYLARQCPEKGLHLLVEAFHLLRAMPDLPPVELHIAGYTSPQDQAFVADLRSRVESWGLADAVRFVGELDRPAKLAFLRGLDLFSVPTIYREAKGLSILEAMAAGVPVVQPRHGSFPELVGATGGGLLVDPESAGALSRGWRTLLLDPERRRQLGRQGRDGVARLFTTAAMAADNLRVYAEVTGLAVELSPELAPPWGDAAEGVGRDGGGLPASEARRGAASA